jgi:hypothetical protein
MKTLLSLLLTCVLTVPASLAVAESAIPNLIGVWKITGTGAILARQSADANPTGETTTFEKLDAENVFVKQEGRVFSGYYKSGGKKEKLVGVISHDNKSAHWAGRFGFGHAKIVSSDTMKVIYLQTNSEGSQAWLETLVRQKKTD